MISSLGKFLSRFRDEWTIEAWRVGRVPIQRRSFVVKAWTRSGARRAAFKSLPETWSTIRVWGGV